MGGLEVLAGCADLVESCVCVGDDDAHGAPFDGVEVFAKGVTRQVAALPALLMR